MTEESREKAKEFLQSQIRRKMEERVATNSTNPRKRRARDPASDKELFDFLSDSESEEEDVAQVSPPNVSDARVEEALLSYWDEPRISQNADPFIYWQQNENKHPEVFLIAKAAFSCPSGSVDSERLFSTAGNVINVRRTRLNPENAEDQIFLAKNLPFFQFRILIAVHPLYFSLHVLTLFSLCMRYLPFY